MSPIADLMPFNFRELIRLVVQFMRGHLFYELPRKAMDAYGCLCGRDRVPTRREKSRRVSSPTTASCVLQQRWPAQRQKASSAIYKIADHSARQNDDITIVATYISLCQLCGATGNCCSYTSISNALFEVRFTLLDVLYGKFRSMGDPVFQEV